MGHRRFVPTPDFIYGGVIVHGPKNLFFISCVQEKSMRTIFYTISVKPLTKKRANYLQGMMTYDAFINLVLDEHEGKNTGYDAVSGLNLLRGMK